MKKSLKYLASILVVGAFFACEPSEIVPDLASSSVAATIDGSTSFTSQSIDANLLVDGADTLLEITATNSENSILLISVQGVKEGVYAANDNVSFKYLKSLGAGVTSSENSINGSLTISSYSESKKTISGSFSFGTKSHTISSGKIKSVVFK